MARREAEEGEIAAVLEAQHIGKARNGGEGGGPGGGVLRLDREPVQVMDHKPRPVGVFLPVVIRGADAAIIGGGGEIEHGPVENDGAVGADGGEEVIHACYRNGAALGHLCRIGDGGERRGGVGVNVPQHHFAQHGALEEIPFDVPGVHVALIPAVDIALKAAAVHRRAVFAEIEDGGVEDVAGHVV